MTRTPDILVIGGGVAGLSAAAALSAHAKVTVIEAEEQIGFHSSGRSATMVHYALGDRLVRALTLASRGFFDSPPAGATDVPLGRRMPVLVHAREEELGELDTLLSEISPFADIERLDPQGMAVLCPILKVGEGGAVAGLADRDGFRLDPHALLQAYLHQLRHNGGELITGARVSPIVRNSGTWQVRSDAGGTWSAPVLVNAAGSWADQIAIAAGVTAIGLEPKRRTIITFDAPSGTPLDRLPFTKTIGNELYFGPESGRLFASPMDEAPSEPSDAQPDEYEVALAAHRMEQRTIVEVERIHSRWAGLRTFTPDRRPAVGFAPDAEGFFWLAGQGGFGLQTSPAMARIAASLIAGEPWPIADATADELSPARLRDQSM